MHTASQEGQKARHDWLIVSSGDHNFTGHESTCKFGAWQNWIDASKTLLQQFYARLSNVAGYARSLLLDNAQLLAGRSRAALEHFVSPRLGNPVLITTFHWARRQGRRLRFAHPMAITVAFMFMLPFVYLVYCIATLPLGGGLVIEPTPSALIVEADSGQVFATRGVFKGDKLSAQDVPLALPGQS
jgi:hypothetical protein